jgi:hypothetical protein
MLKPFIMFLTFAALVAAVALSISPPGNSGKKSDYAKRVTQTTLTSLAH